MVLVRYVEGEKDCVVYTKEEQAELPEDVQENEVFYIDGLLKKKLEFGMQLQERDNDVCANIIGNEGSGKSGVGVTCARFVSRDTFNPITDMIGAEDDEAQVFEKLEALPQNGVIVFDEGNRYFLSTEVMKKSSRELHKIFSIFRQKNLFVFIILPSFFRMASYFALDRSDFLIRTYLKNGDRSYFEYWGKKKKDKLYRIGRKTHDYGCVSPTFRGRFTKCHLLENKEYKDFKEKTMQKAFAEARAKKNKPKSEFEIKQQVIKDFVVKNTDKTSKELASFLGVGERRIQYIRKEYKDSGSSLE
jgi:hypothetical protein